MFSIYILQGTTPSIQARKNWTPGYPRNIQAYKHVMLRLMSSTFLYFGREDGYINVPDRAIGYPLCYYRPGIYAYL